MSTGSIIKRDGKRGVSYLLKYDAGTDPVTGKRRQRYATVRGTKAQAAAKLRELMGKVDAGTDIDPSRMTLAAWVETWLADHLHDLGTRTAERYGELLRRHVLPRLGSKPIQKIAVAHINGLYSTLRKEGRAGTAGTDASGLAPRTIHHVHRVLSRCLKIAARNQVIVSNPCGNAEAPKVRRAHDASGRPAVRALDQDAIGKLLDSLRGRPLFPIVALALATGMRRGELLALQWSAVDLDGKRLRIERSVDMTKAHGIRLKAPKNESSRRMIDLDEHTVAMLRAHWRAQAEQALRLGMRLPADALVFPSSILEPARARHPSSFSTDFTIAAASAGFTGLRFHDLRHSHATLLLLAGVPASAVAARLGHSTPVTTMNVYSHVLRRAEENAAAIAGAMLRAALARPE